VAPGIKGEATSSVRVCGVNIALRNSVVQQRRGSTRLHQVELLCVRPAILVKCADQRFWLNVSTSDSCPRVHL
jgi:hypothetical protein